MGEFIRERLPDPVSYFDGEGVRLIGPGRWKTGRCLFHGGSDSLRVNTVSGGWCCMSCGVKGGDVLAHHMQRHGLPFVEAARALGAYVGDASPGVMPARTTPLPARDAMQLAAFELQLAMIVISDIKAGVIPSETDWQRFLTCAGRVELLAAEYRS
jgi:hypothetical protein